MSIILGLVLLVWAVGVPYWYGYFTHFDKEAGPGAVVWPVVLFFFVIYKVVTWLRIQGRKRAIK